MSVPEQSPIHDAAEQLQYFLTRAEQESIAAIRSTNGVVADRHLAMAEAYSAMAVMMLGDTVEASAPN